MAGAVMVHAAAAHPVLCCWAAADPHPAPREAFARDLNARAYEDVRMLVADPAVEVVYIATPHQFHAPHAILAAEHGKHVILEKPMALTLADCDAIIAAVERHKVHLIVGHTHAFDPAVRLMREIIARGELGRLGLIHSFNYTNYLYRPRRPEELDTAKGGGILFNQVPHQIDTARLLAGGVVRACARRLPCSTGRARPRRAVPRCCNSPMAPPPRWSTAATIISIPMNGISALASEARRRRSRMAQPAARSPMLPTRAKARTETFAYGALRAVTCRRTSLISA